MTTDNTTPGTPAALDGIVAEAASALADAIELASVGRGREGSDDEAGLELASPERTIAIGDGSYGLLATIGGVPVRIIVEPARDEEREAVTGVRKGAVAPGDTITYRAAGHTAERTGRVEVAVPTGVWVIRDRSQAGGPYRARVEWEMITGHHPVVRRT
jgi:hypothetical protein